VEAVLVRHRNAEQFADDRDRQRRGERLHQVGRRASLDHAVHQSVGDLVGARPEHLHPAGGERLGDELAQPGVLGRVHREDSALESLRGHPRLVARHRGGAAEAGVTEDESHVGVAGGEPRLLAERQPHPRERFSAAELGVERIQVEPIGRAKRVGMRGTLGIRHAYASYSLLSIIGTGQK
jgi:hypothetical protein